MQPIEPQTRVKSGRNAFFLPGFQFIFDLSVLQPNIPLGSIRLQKRQIKSKLKVWQKERIPS